MYISANVVERIKFIAKEKNISIGVMLKECDLSKNTLSSMLSRGSWIQANNLAKIADYLNCSVDYLLGRTDDPINHDAPDLITTKERSSIIKNMPTVSDEHLTNEEYEIIKEYRAHPEYRDAIKRILGISKPSPYASIAAYGDGSVQTAKKKRKITE